MTHCIEKGKEYKSAKKPSSVYCVRQSFLARLGKIGQTGNLIINFHPPLRPGLTHQNFSLAICSTTFVRNSGSSAA